MNARIYNSTRIHVEDGLADVKVYAATSSKSRWVDITMPGTPSHVEFWADNLDALEAQGQAIVDAVRTYRREQMLLDAAEDFRQRQLAVQHADATDLVPAPADGTF